MNAGERPGLSGPPPEAGAQASWREHGGVPGPVAERVEAVRAFNRFYTTVVGALREGLLRTPYTLTEARVVFELAQSSPGAPADATRSAAADSAMADGVEVVRLRRALDLDAGYLSRILNRFDADGLVTRRRSTGDARRQVARLTDRGRQVFATLDARSAEEIAALLAGLTETDQERLLVAMRTIREVLGDPVHRPDGTARARAVLLRAPGPGEYGWVVARHGALYAAEHGWDARFEALVARIVADFAEHHDPEREAAWIAEVDGEPAGCVFCVTARDDDAHDEAAGDDGAPSDTADGMTGNADAHVGPVAQLRLLLVEPDARGLGVGARLVEQCVRFARTAGYRRMVLWTNDVLVSARRIYEAAGFTLVDEERHDSFGPELVGQRWSRPL